MVHADIFSEPVRAFLPSCHPILTANFQTQEEGGGANEPGNCPAHGWFVEPVDCLPSPCRLDSIATNQTNQLRSDHPTDSMSPAEELPQELWTQILSALTWRHRLSVCALVCQKLRRAAAAATQEVHVWAPDSAPQRANDFLSWTSSYGSSLTALHLDFGVRGGSVRQLAACPNLVQLKLVGCSVQLGAGSGDMGLLHSCTALTHLVLSNVTLLDVGLDKPAAGMAAAPVARLQSLALRSCDLPDGPEGPQQTAQVLRECLVPHLASLTHFELHFSLLYSALMHHLSTMVRLEQLSLRGAGESEHPYRVSAQARFFLKPRAQHNPLRRADSSPLLHSCC